MNIAYIFRENEADWLPYYYHYSRELFMKLSGLGGVWNAERRGFSFRKRRPSEEGISSDQLKTVFNIICVIMPGTGGGDDSPVIRISGFLEKPCDNEAERMPPSRESENRKIRKKEDTNPFSFPRNKTLPDNFSAYWLDKLETELRSRKYSAHTRSVYIYYNRLFCRAMKKTPEEMTPEDVKEFLAGMEKTKKYSVSAMNLALSAIKFFFRNILKNNSISEQHRPCRDERLPMIFSKEEIVKVFGTEKNPKHRLLLMLVYSSGLRVSEVVALKKEHIDLERNAVYVKQGKGRKDRYTLLSEKAAAFIKDYYEFFHIEKWLFPGQNETRHLTIRSAQNIFDKAVRRAGITKRITIHGLRHTFATHLLESGTDIRYIQALLGHESLRTTERYTHVAQGTALKIKSPLDSI